MICNANYQWEAHWFLEHFKDVLYEYHSYLFDGKEDRRFLKQLKKDRVDRVDSFYMVLCYD